MVKTQFCIPLTVCNPREREWLKSRLHELSRMQENFTDEEYLAHGAFLGFDVREEDDRILLFSLENGNLQHLTLFIQEFLSIFHPTLGVGIEFAQTSDCPIPKAFSGGAMYVTAQEVRFAPDIQIWLACQTSTIHLPQLRQIA